MKPSSLIHRLLKLSRKRLSSKRNQLAFFALLLLIILIPLAIYLTRTPSSAEAAWATDFGNWLKRQRVQLANTSGESLAANVPVAITVDTQALVNAGKLQSDCDDLRVVYQPDSTTSTELDRSLSMPGGLTCGTSTSTTVTFKLQTALGASGITNDYYLYYANTGASTPTNPDNAYDLGSKNALLVCPFAGSTTCAAGETLATGSTSPQRYSGATTALQFDGANDYASAADSASLSVTGSLTVEAWVHPQAVNTEQTLVGKWDETNAGNDRSYRLLLKADNRFAFEISENGTLANVATVSAVTTSTTTNTWYHVAGVYDSVQKTLRLFINGFEDANSAVTTSISAIDNNASLLYVGAKEDFGGNVNTNFSGLIDEVKISNAVLYHSPFTPTTTPAISSDSTAALYHLDAAGADPRSSGTAVDSTLNANHLTLSGTNFTSGLIGVDGDSITNLTHAKLASQTLSSLPALLIESPTTNRSENPSFENDLFYRDWFVHNPDTSTVGTTAHTIAIGSGYQRKTWHDGSRFWVCYYTGASNLIDCYYSTDATTWTKNSSASISTNGTSDFTIIADGSNAFMLKKAVADMVMYQATSYPGTNFDWGSPTTVFDGTAPSITYNAATLAKDADGYLWAGTTVIYDSARTTLIASRSASPNSISGTWIGQPTFATASSVLNSTAISIAPLTDGDVYALFYSATHGGLRGCYFDSANNSWEDSSGNVCNATNIDNIFTTSVATTVNSFTVDPTNFDIHLASATTSNYCNGSASSYCYLRYDLGTKAWQTGVDLTDAASIYRTISVNTASGDIYTIYNEGNDVTSRVCDVSAAASGCSTLSDWSAETIASSETDITNAHLGSNYSGNNAVWAVWKNAIDGDDEIRFKMILNPNLTDTVNTDTNYVKFGERSASLVSAATSDYRFSLNPQSTDTHTLSAFLYQGTGGAVGAAIDSTIAKLVFNGTVQTPTYTDMGGGWWRLSYTAAAGSGSQDYGLNILGGKTVYADGIQLEASSSATTYTDGSLGSGYSWLGPTHDSLSTRSAQLVRYTTSGNLQASAGSFAAWVKPLWSGNDNLEHNFFASDTSSGALRLYKSTGNNLTLTDGTNTATVDISTWVANAWHHVVATWDGTSYLDVYVDGSAGSGSAAFSAPTLGTNLHLGSNASDQLFADAAFSDVRFYDAVLSSAEVADLYQAGLIARQQTAEIDQFGAKGEAPVAIWHFDNLADSVTHDSSLYGNHLTVSGAVLDASASAQSATPVGRTSLSFDGTNDFVSRVNDPDFNFGTGDFTLTGWFKHPVAISGTDTLLARYGSAGFKVYLNSSGYVCFGIDDDSSFGPDDSVCSTVSYADSNWHHLSAVKTGTASIAIWVDANRVGNLDSLTATGSLNSTATLYLGIDSDGASNPWTGNLDEWYLYPYARSEAQIKVDALGGAAQSFAPASPESLQQGLVGYWKMDENVTGDAKTLKDYSGNNYHLTTVDGANNTGMACTVSGKYGNGCSLDGYDDYLSRADIDAFDFAATDSFTLSSWFKKPTQAAQVFYGGHEAGDFSEYTTTITDSGDLSVTSAAALAGTGYGMSVYINDTTTIYGQKAITTSNSGVARARFYFDPNSNTMPDNANFYLFRLISLASNVFANVRFNYEDGIGYRIHPTIVDDLGSENNVGQYPISDMPHLIEVKLTRATTNISSDGSYEIWIDGIFQGSLTNIDNYDRFDSLSYIRLGASGPSSGFSGTFYLDELVVNTDGAVIGPAQNVIASKIEATGADGGYQVRLEADGNITFGITDDNTSFPEDAVTSTAGTYDDGNWHQVTATKNGTTDISLFIDGDFVGHDTSISSTGTLANNDSFYLGMDGDSLAQTWVGYLDETKVYNRALSPAEVQGLYNSAPGPVGYWKLDEGSGETANDSSGNGYNGNISTLSTGSYIWSQGQYGNALQFNDPVAPTSNQGAYVNIPDNDVFSPVTSGAFTVEAWVNQQSLTDDSYFVNKRANSNYEWYLGRTDGGLVQAVISSLDGSTSYLGVGWTTSWTLNSWHHLALTFDNSIPSLKLYIDGVFKDQDTTTTGTYGNGTAPLRIGCDYPGWNCSDATIDDVKIYNYARTQKQILEDMNANHPAPGSPIGSPVAHWKFDDLAGTTAQDSGNNDLDFTLSAASWTTNGKFGGAWNGGDNLRLTKTDNTALEAGANEDFSISIWFKSDGATTAATEYLLDKALTAGSAGYRLTFNTSGQLICGIDDDATSFPEDAATSPADVYDAAWHHAVCVRDITADKLLLYVDSQLVATDPDLSATGSFDSTASLYIGDEQATNGTDEFLGDVDELQLFRSALTPDQVKLLYNGSYASSWGASSTTSTGTTSNSSSDSYCPPGQDTACVPPVAHWKLDENDGQYAYDISGNNLPLTLGANSSVNTSDPAWAPGKFSSALDFDGVNDYAFRNDNDLLTPANDMTAEIWFKMDTLASVAGRTYILFSKNNSTSPYQSYNCEIRPTVYLDNLQCYWVGDDNGEYSITHWVTPLTANAWYHMAFVKQGSTLKILLNGQKHPYFGGTITGSTTMKNSDDDFALGANIGAYVYWFDGQLDNFRLYDYARTPAQIAWDYNQGAPVAWYKFDETSWTSDCSTDAVFDSSGNALHADVCPNGTGQTTPETGKRNNAMHFDDSNDYVTTADTYALDLTSGLSISAWVNADANEADNVIVSKGTSYEVGLNADGDVYWDGAGAAVDDGEAKVLAGSWHHVLVTNDDTTVTIYVDGVKTTALPAGIDSDNSTALRIGYDGTNYFDGLIDDVKIWNYPLTQKQVQIDYAAGAVSFSQ